MKRKQISSDLIDYVEKERLIYYDYINDERLAKQVVSYLMRAEIWCISYKAKMKQRGLDVPRDIEKYDELGITFRIVDKNMVNL